MDNILVEVLKKIEDEGFDAYVVGGYVRDLLLNKHSDDYDICTNARVEDLDKIFNIHLDNNYGSSILIYKDKHFEITTYREEYNYTGVRTPMVNYVDDLETDLKRRDFTINAIVMNSQGKIIDKLNGCQDLKNKIIRCIGDADKKLNEDPLRILRTIRFASILGFTIDSELEIAIKNNRDKIMRLSSFRKKQELDKIFAAGGYPLLKKYNLLDYLEISGKNLVNVHSSLGIWAQLKHSNSYEFTKDEKIILKGVREIIDDNKISDYDLYKYNFDIIDIASLILNDESVKEKYNSLVIKSRDDIKISNQDILNNTDILPSVILNYIERKIINRELENSHEKLINYIKNLNVYDIDK